MRVKLVAGRTTPNFVIYNAAADEQNEGMERVIFYMPRKAAREKAPMGHEFPEYLYLDVQAG